MNIELTAEQANEVIVSLQALSDRLVKDHEAEYSGVAKFLILSSIQMVDRLVVDIRDQVEAQSEVMAHA